MHFPLTGEPRGHLLAFAFGALLMGDFVRIRAASHRPAALWMRRNPHSFPIDAFEIVAFKGKTFSFVCQELFFENGWICQIH
jgi:hypothetical protein